MAHARGATRRYAVVAIRHSVLYAGTVELAERIQHEAYDRHNVAVAEGALSVLRRCSVEEAAQLLRSAAVANHEALADAAARLMRQLA